MTIKRYVHTRDYQRIHQFLTDRYNETKTMHAKAKACHYGFHSEDDDGILTGPFREGRLSYQAKDRHSVD